MKKLRLIFTLMLALLTALPALVQAGSTPVENGYTLEQVLIFSRHGIRSPFMNAEFLYRHTPHRWYQWTVASGELSPRGGQVETRLGQYFQADLIANSFMPHNWEPEEGEVRFFANSYQRTIATAQYFSSGMLPIANVTVERHYALNKKDPVFNPGKAPLADPAYRKALVTEVMQQGGAKGLAGLGAGLEPQLDLLAQVLDIDHSPAAQDGSFTGFDPADTKAEVTADGYSFRSSVLTGAQLADALIMQYYEDSTDNAAFGRQLSAAEWRQLGRIFDRSLEVLTNAPSFAGARNYYLLREMLAELNTEGRRFSFLCGHDNNLASLKTQLRIADYDLPDTPVNSPIGGKLVLEKWRDEDGSLFMDVRLVYPGASQIRGNEDFTLQNPPRSYPLQLTGVERGAYGLYRYEDVLQRMQEGTEYPFEM